VSARRWWIAAIVAVLAVSLAARAVAGRVTREVLVVDAVALLAGAALIRAGLRRAAGLTPRARRWQRGLAVSFVLGAVRAVLWAAGASVQLANATTLAMACIAVLVWAALRRRSASVGPRSRPGETTSRER
jgi:hypothetical protein